MPIAAAEELLAINRARAERVRGRRGADMASCRAKRARPFVIKFSAWVLSAIWIQVWVWEHVLADIGASGASAAVERVEFCTQKNRLGRLGISTAGMSRQEPRMRKGELKLEGPPAKNENSRQKTAPS